MTVASARLPRPVPAAPILSSLAVLGAVLLGPLVLRDPWLAGLAVLGAALATAVFVHPPVAGYVVAVIPLLAGLGRGTVVPLIRPGEAVTVVVAAALLARVLLALATGDSLPGRLRAADASLFFLALAGSLLPVLFLVARGQSVSQDDVLYSFQLLKFAVVYLIVRLAIRTDEQVGRCLRLSLVVGGIAAVIGILQALGLFGVRDLLFTHYPPTDDALFETSRASSTLAHPFAMADLMVFNLAIAGAWWVRSARRPAWLALAAAVFAVGALAAGEFSGALALVVAVTALGVMTRRLGRALLALLPVAVVAGVILQPVIDARLQGFSSPQGLPDSWLGRLHNLQHYVWPKLATGINWVVGVRPSAKVPIGNGAAPYVYIESGYLWLLWVGGIPLLVAFVVFLVANLRATRRVAEEPGFVGVAGTAAFVALSVIAVLTVLDPHVTLRGSGDLLFALLALAYVRTEPEPTGSFS